MRFNCNGKVPERQSMQTNLVHSYIYQNNHAKNKVPILNIAQIKLIFNLDDWSNKPM